ncbi:MAG: hypothetical protein QOE71_1023 [Pseudonocardiales bacterium]|jgi:hypothetical protein|nr:hypothetical protein [Pseudonocardiales bacterium]
MHQAGLEEGVQTSVSGAESSPIACSTKLLVQARGVAGSSRPSNIACGAWHCRTAAPFGGWHSSSAHESEPKHLYCN